MILRNIIATSYGEQAEDGPDRHQIKLIGSAVERSLALRRRVAHPAARGPTHSTGELMTGVAKKILLVDDDADLREALAEQLMGIDDFDVYEAETGAAGVERARTEMHDLVILDVGLPDMDGREVCREMRRGGVKCPIIMLTGQDSDADTIQGLEAGANDYVTKPFKFPVLMARIRAQLRQHEQSEDAVFAVGPYSFRPGTKTLVDEAERRVRLTEKETNILKYLYRAGGRTVERETLLREVWGYNAGVTTHTLETHIYRLRQKIEPDPSNARILLTDAGGYRLSM